MGGRTHESTNPRINLPGSSLPARVRHSGGSLFLVAHIDGDDDIVDFRFCEFRTATSPIRMIEFIPFDSERGEQFMRKIAIVPCAGCGELRVQPRDGARHEVRYHRCGHDNVP